MKKLAIALFALSATVTSQAADLKSVFEQALVNDPQLAAELALANANGQSQGLAGQAIMPTVTLSADIGSTSIDAYGAVPKTDTDTTSYTLQAVQPIIAPQSWYGYGAAKAASDSAQLELAKAQQSLVVRISEAYFNVLRANAGLASAKAQEAAVKRQLEQTQQRFKVGLIAITDVHEAQAVYDGATVELIAAESQLDIAYEALALLTGERYDRINPLKETIPLVGPVPADRTAWEQKALGQNLDVLIAEKSQLSAQRNHKSKISGHLPTVNLVGRYSSSDQLSQMNPDQDDITSTYVGVQVSLPIFSGGATWAGQKQAYYQRQAAEKSLEAAQRGATLNIRTLYRQLEADVARIKARKQAMTSAKSAMEATQTGYEVGTRNIVEVLQAQLSVFSAQRDYEFSRYDYVVDLLKFRQAAGELSVADIDEINAWLQK
ncbi:efflux transporter outer membrane subunit OpmH [Oceaniserpentilla sp. 4NH20-0058]|uniref:TolC family outer membrane protein n=1 Tax=Oceaniserpentilla sp. 4NH20-0058 TaxID=3127660 RepID=UPI0031029091